MVKIELFKISWNREDLKITASEELTESDIAAIVQYTFFYGRNKSVGKKLLNLLAQVNSCTSTELIENWDRLYKK